MTIGELLAGDSVVLLDGATGTELERRGFPLREAGWSARAIDDAPQLLSSIHHDYAAAGARIVTANTFRLHRRNLAGWGREEDAETLVRRAVELARGAVSKECLIAGSLAPLGDCYSPGDVPAEEELQREHAELAGALAGAGVDVILVETMVAIREARAAAKAASATGVPFVVSCVCGNEGRLLSGEPLADAIASFLPFGPAAVCVNCLSLGQADVAVKILAGHCGRIPFGVYANTGELGADGLWRVTNAVEPAVYAVAACGWRRAGARLIGGCCGTTPAHIEALKTSIFQDVMTSR